MKIKGRKASEIGSYGGKGMKTPEGNDYAKLLRENENKCFTDGAASIVYDTSNQQINQTYAKLATHHAKEGYQRGVRIPDPEGTRRKRVYTTFSKKPIEELFKDPETIYIGKDEIEL